MPKNGTSAPPVLHDRRGKGCQVPFSSGTLFMDALVILVCVAQRGFAWGREGHEVVALIAERVAQSPRCWDSAVLSVRYSCAGIDNRGIIQCKSRRV